MSFSFISRMPGVVFAISNIVEQTLGESYCFVISLSFMSPTAVVFIAVNRIVEQKFSECY